MSYGVNSPQGLQPFRYLNGALWNGQQSTYRIDPTVPQTFFTGDPVSIDAGGFLVPGEHAPNTTVGVFNGCRFLVRGGNDNAPLDFPLWNNQATLPAGTYVTAYVIDDPNVLFNVQVNNFAPNGIVVQDIGKNIDYAVGAGGSLITGQSGYVLDYATLDNLATRDLTVYDITPVIGNPGVSTASSEFNNALVLINNHRFKAGVAGA